jgi:SpoVK/Ycf46/Vps4 family AAA+-type ATPase
VDTDSRLQLIRTEHPVVLDVEPIWSESVAERLHQIVNERGCEAELLSAGLRPTKSALFTGPPGVGKSLAARWISATLDRPLLTLDLSAVMSSYLGRTGANVRHVLDYAKGTDSVLFLDELDAVAKRRDDVTEIGELKRLVTVLLQEIDDWSSPSILLAATNHSDLLDPAVWRRFEMVIDFPMPSDAQLRQAIAQLLPAEISEATREALVISTRGISFSDVERDFSRARREAITHKLSIEDRLYTIMSQRAAVLSHRERKELAVKLVEAKLSERHAQRITGVDRKTIGRAISEQEGAVAEKR